MAFQNLTTFKNLTFLSGFQNGTAIRLQDIKMSDFLMFHVFLCADFGSTCALQPEKIAQIWKIREQMTELGRGCFTLNKMALKNC